MAIQVKIKYVRLALFAALISKLSNHEPSTALIPAITKVGKEHINANIAKIYSQASQLDLVGVVLSADLISRN